MVLVTNRPNLLYMVKSVSEMEAAPLLYTERSQDSVAGRTFSTKDRAGAFQDLISMSETPCSFV